MAIVMHCMRVYIPRMLGQLAMQIATLIFALGLLCLVAYMKVQADTLIPMLEKAQQEGVATPPPEPPQERNTATAVAITAVWSYVRDWDNLGRNHPLLL